MREDCFLRAQTDTDYVRCLIQLSILVIHFDFNRKFTESLSITVNYRGLVTELEQPSQAASEQPRNSWHRVFPFPPPCPKGKEGILRCSGFQVGHKRVPVRYGAPIRPRCEDLLRPDQKLGESKRPRKRWRRSIESWIKF